MLFMHPTGTALVAAILGLTASPAVYAHRLHVPSFGPDLSGFSVSQADVLSADSAYLSPATLLPPLEVAKQFLHEHVKLQPGFSYMVKNTYASDVSGVTHVYFKQTLNDMEVVNGDASVNVDRFGRIMSFSSSFYQGQVPSELHDTSAQIQGQQMVMGRSPLTPTEAVVAFAQFLGLSRVPQAERLLALAYADDHEHVFPGNTQGDAVTVVSHVDFAVKNEVPVMRKYLIVTEPEHAVVPVWDLVAEMSDADNYFNAQVHISSGRVLQVVDWVSEAKYTVYPIGVNDPADGERSLVVNPEDAKASPLGWHDQGESDRRRGGDGKFKETVGNNVWAQSNPDGRSTYENNYRPQGDGPQNDLTFDFTLDLKKNPTEYIDSAITNLFYWNNIMHDVFYQYGFDEKSGNFQENNFGRGGKDSDSVIANAQDGSGYNNANFATPPDGSKGRMRMYTWTTSRPSRDGDLEAGIIIHEYAHGISTRLTGGPANSGCLGFGESGGMGEGWGDTFATMLRMRKEYTSDIEFGMGEYSAGRGIRPFPYSRSLKTNPHTYSWIRKPAYGGVHAIGSVWASMLYEVYWTFVEKHGFDADWYSVAKKERSEWSGNVIFLQLLVDGMKLQPCRPSFVDARNALIKADEAIYDGEHVCLLWTAFAKRGLGAEAKKGGIESFDVPQECA